MLCYGAVTSGVPFLFVSVLFLKSKVFMHVCFLVVCLPVLDQDRNFGTVKTSDLKILNGSLAVCDGHLSQLSDTL